MQRVVLIGASADAEKYAYRAFQKLRENGHEVIPVHPKLESLEGVKVLHSIEEVSGPIDTVTLYVSKAISSSLGPAILRAKPKRIIFNPGAENRDLAEAAAKAGIETLEACTLVMLSTHQFDK